MDYEYTFYFEPLAEGGYNVSVPAIPEICTFGSTVEEAREIADADPMHVSGARTYQLRPWSLSNGSIGVRVSLSNPRREIL